jgi:hypothetical protein
MSYEPAVNMGISKIKGKRLSNVWSQLDVQTKREVCRVIIQEQETYDEALYQSCMKHQITAAQFLLEVEKHDDLAQRYNVAIFKAGKLNNIDLTKTALSTLFEILNTPTTEKIEWKVDEKTGDWKAVKKWTASNQDTRIQISKFLLERLHMDFNMQTKQIQIQAAMDIIKALSTSDKVTPVEATNIQIMLNEWLRQKGIDISEEL